MSFQTKYLKQLKKYNKLCAQAKQLYDKFNDAFNEATKQMSPNEYKQSPEYVQQHQAAMNAIERASSEVETLNEQYKQRNFVGLDSALAFLNTTEKIHRGGYQKEELCKHLKFATLKASELEVLESVLFDQIKTAGREWSAMSQLFVHFDPKQVLEKCDSVDTEGKDFIEARLHKLRQQYQ